MLPHDTLAKRQARRVLAALEGPAAALPMVVWTAHPEEARADLRCRCARILDIVAKPDLAELEWRLKIALGSLELGRV